MFQVYVLRRGESCYELAAVFATKLIALAHLGMMLNRGAAWDGYVVQGGAR